MTKISVICREREKIENSKCNKKQTYGGRRNPICERRRSKEVSITNTALEKEEIK